MSLEAANKILFSPDTYNDMIPLRTRVYRGTSGTVYQKTADDHWVSSKDGREKDGATLGDSKLCPQEVQELGVNLDAMRKQLLIDAGVIPSVSAKKGDKKVQGGQEFIYNGSEWTKAGSTKNMAENETPISTPEAVKNIFQDAGAMALAVKMRLVIHRFVTEKMGDAYPEKMKGPTGEAVAGLIELVLAHYAVTQFYGSIPKADILKAAVERALTYHIANNMVLFMEFVGPFLGELKGLVSALSEMNGPGGEMNLLSMFASASEPAKEKEKVGAGGASTSTSR